MKFLIPLFLIPLCLIGRSHEQFVVIKLKWDASESPGVTNYIVYSGAESKRYTATNSVNGTNLTLKLGAMVRGSTYFFTATAVENGIESGYSNEVRYRVPNRNTTTQ